MRGDSEDTNCPRTEVFDATPRDGAASDRLVIPWLKVALIAEGHPMIAADLAGRLRQWGAREVYTTTTVARACTIIESIGASCDLALCDVYLEDGRCDAIVAATRRSAPAARIVLMTGEAAPQERGDLSYSICPHDFISKPFHMDFLRHRLATVDERLTRQAAAAFYNLALLSGLPAASASVRERALKRVIADAEGNVSEAARRVRMNRTHLHRLIAERDEAAAHEPRATDRLQVPECPSHGTVDE